MIFLSTNTWLLLYVTQTFPFFLKTSVGHSKLGYGYDTWILYVGLKQSKVLILLPCLTLSMFDTSSQAWVTYLLVISSLEVGKHYMTEYREKMKLYDNKERLLNLPNWWSTLIRNCNLIFWDIPNSPAEFCIGIGVQIVNVPNYTTLWYSDSIFQMNLTNNFIL